MDQTLIHLPTRLIFGRGRINELGIWLPLEYQRILIVTDRLVAELSGAMAGIQEKISDRTMEVFSGVEENPSFDTIAAGAKIARRARSQCVLGVGGGSPMDAAKGIAWLAKNDLLPNELAAGQKPVDAPLPIVCIPTTSGTGSEATPYAVFTDKANQNKCGYASERIYPLFSIIDPQLAFSMPGKLAVHTGLDVLAHAAEAFLSTLASPFSDLLARQALELVVSSLPAAAKKDPAAMERMSYAAMIAGIAIAHAGTILPHIMGYPLTLFHSLPHGLASAVLLPAFLKFLGRKGAVPEKLKVLEEVFASVGGIAGFLSALGVSVRLADHGVRSQEIPLYVQKTIVKSDVAITPAVVTADDIAAIYLS